VAIGRLVYIVRERGSLNPCKVGTCREDRLLARMKDLQSGNPHPLVVAEIILTESAGVDLERVLHSELRAMGLLVRGEWFRVPMSDRMPLVVDCLTKARRTFRDSSIGGASFSGWEAFKYGLIPEHMVCPWSRPAIRGA
jgi:hypothetical protein